MHNKGIPSIRCAGVFMAAPHRWSKKSTTPIKTSPNWVHCYLMEPPSICPTLPKPQLKNPSDYGTEHRTRDLNLRLSYRHFFGLARRALAGRYCFSRSEEHTSELQSLRHL